MTETHIDELWAPFAKPMVTADDYLKSLGGRGLNVWYLGEHVDEPVDHPVLRPSANAVAETYRLAAENPELGGARTEQGKRVNRFLHVANKPEDLLAKHDMQRELGRRTGTCFQRCVGVDALGACHIVTFDMDAKNGTDYHQRLLAFLGRAQTANVVIGGAMTDPKGDRSKPPHEQIDLDLFLRVVRRDDKGIYVSGAKMHQTGVINSHWIIFMPTMRLTEKDKDWAGEIDAGNAKYAGTEAIIVFKDVFVPHEHVFMDGEWAFASSLVSRFTTFHRSSYACKTGLGDVLIGAAAAAAEQNGVEKASHIKDKLVEMTHLNETIYSSCVAGAARSVTMHSGAQINDEMLSNVAKQNVTRFPYDIARLAQDIAGGLIVTMPSEKELMNKETGPLMLKFLQTKGGVSVTDRMRMLRLIENMTIGRNAVGYLTESMHGAGSPQAQRIEIGRGMELEIKKGLALYLCGAADVRDSSVDMLIGHEEPRLPIDHVGVGQSRELELTHAWVGETVEA
jgi:4-hydroxybutyryl-CoA dehydratase/vinylacetyl-CoA-Delta-isomerase